MNVSKTREAVWAAAFVRHMTDWAWRLRSGSRGKERLRAAKNCAKHADMAVELFELAVAPAGDATVKELSELRADSDENADAADKAYQRAEKAESDLAALRKELDEALGTRDGGQRCQSCGRLYSTVWKADDALWEKVSGAESPGGGLRCPLCFMREADESLRWSVGSGDFPDCVLDHALLEAMGKHCEEEGWCVYSDDCPDRAPQLDCPLFAYRPAPDNGEKEGS